ncbi:MAG: hypothetical protein ABI358_14580 [Ginsengibacter sp.]
MDNIKTLAALKTELVKNVDLQNQFKADPVKAIQQISTSPSPLPDNWIYRIVVGSLGLAVILITAAVVILTFNKDSTDKNVPTILTAIASGAIGALAGLLAPSPGAKAAE